MIEELKIRTPDDRVKSVPLDGDEISLGRAHDNTLCYPDDASLSRRHVKFCRNGERWSVVDLGSKNGTVVNGDRVHGSRTLESGDRLSVGQLTIVYGEAPTGSNVVFVDGDSTAGQDAATIMASLKGLLSDETPLPASRGKSGLASSAREQFQLPIVKALIRAGRELAGHQPLSELFETILGQAISAVGAERGLLMTLEQGKLVTQASHGDGFRISSTVRDRVIDNKESLLVRDVGREQALQNQLSISEQQIHSLLAVPLQAHEGVIGLIYVDSRSFVHEFTSDDLNLLTVLANVAAIRIDHERHLELQRLEARRNLDLEQAAEIQRGILPSGPPRVPGLDVAGHNAPCLTVGGDYYDFIRYPDDQLGLVLGDVAGKGMAAAMLMSNLQARVQLLTEQPGDLAPMISRLDRSIAASCPANRFITLFMCVIDATNGATRYCNAGHNPPIVVRADGRVERLTAAGTVLGMLPELGYEEHRTTLEPGDLIAIFSDGVTEACNPLGEEFGEARLGSLLQSLRERPAAAIISAVMEAVAAWAPDATGADDITIVIARRLVR